MILDARAPRFRPRDFVFTVARSPAHRRAYRDLRRAIFVEEQRVFEESDADARDRHMIPIVCVSLLLGMEDRVAGGVRIDEREPRVWWGSRLGVDRRFRRLRLGPSVAVRNRQPVDVARSIGGGLIYTAVSTANALGCDAFYAHVQRQNVPLFRKLRWRPLRELELHGRPHVLMEADLDFYAPAEPGLCVA